MKKMLCMILAIVMCLSVCAPAYASGVESIDSTENVELVEKRIQQEILAMEEAVWADLHRQLAAQNALDGMPYFQAALQPEIEQVVYAKYNLEPPTNSTQSLTANYSYNFPNGGMVHYTGSLNTENAVLFMTDDQTLRYYYNPVTFSDYVSEVLGYIPLLSILTLASSFSIVLEQLAKQEIEAADYYSRMLHISWGAGAEQATYAYGWTTYPTATVYSANSITGVYSG